MSGSDDTEEVVEKVADWVSAAFPDRQCMRCGYDRFYILDSPPQQLAEGPLTFAKWPITKISCRRCGFIEEHLTGVLKNSLEKNNFSPLPKGTNSGE